MTYFSPNEIFDLLGSVNCERDILEIQDYVHENWIQYTPLDVSLFLQTIRLLKGIFA